MIRRCVWRGRDLGFRIYRVCRVYRAYGYSNKSIVQQVVGVRSFCQTLADGNKFYCSQLGLGFRSADVSAVSV